MREGIKISVLFLFLKKTQKYKKGIDKESNMVYDDTASKSYF